MRIAVTGSAGFLGSRIVDALVEQGHEVLSIDNLSGGFRRNFNDKATIEVIDLCQKEAVEWAFKKFEPEIIYHCAANAREGASFFDPAKIVMANQVATINTLEAAIKTKSFRKWIGMSSMAAYGEQEPPFIEDMPLKPCDVYGIAKASMEETIKVLAKCYKFDYTIVRPHNIFGERQSIRDKYRNYIGICMNHIMRGEPVYIYGDGQQKRQFSYIEDSMPCYLKLLDSCNGETINIGGTLAYTIEHVAFMVIEAMMEDLTYPIVYLPERYGEVKFAYCNPAKSIKLLGYEDKIGVEEGIVRMSRWSKTMGAQDWVNESLALDSEYIPSTWRK
jgi:UDP-glucose 4-epimerase